MKKTWYGLLIAFCAALCLIASEGPLAAKSEGFDFSGEETQEDMKLTDGEEQGPKILSLSQVQHMVFSYMQLHQEMLNALKNDGRDNASELRDARKREFSFFLSGKEQPQFSGSARDRAAAERLWEEMARYKSGAANQIQNLLTHLSMENIFEINTSMELNLRFLRANESKIKEESKAFYKAYLMVVRVADNPKLPLSMIYSAGFNAYVLPSGQLGPRTNIFAVLDYHSREIGDKELEKRKKTCEELLSGALEQCKASYIESSARLRALKAGKDVENLLALDNQIIVRARDWLSETKKMAETLLDPNSPQGSLLHYNLGSSSETLWSRAMPSPNGTDYAGWIKRINADLQAIIKKNQKR